MTGLAQSRDNGGGSTLAGARCSPANINGATDCAARFFVNSDSRESTSRGDWDYGYVKGECAPGRYVKGVARYGDLEAAAVFCCSPE